MDKRTTLQQMTFGARVAEDEAAQLHAYFVETDLWRRIFAGEIDVVKGAKGTGKSALYALLLDRQNDLFDRGILLIPAENPRGTPAFGSLVLDPPASEEDFRNLWKLYFLSLVANTLRDYRITNDAARTLIAALTAAHLLPYGSTLTQRLRAALDYIRSLTHVSTIEPSVGLDPSTGLPTASAKISLREPSSADRARGHVSIDDLLGQANIALSEEHLHVWIVIDRLDVAFAESPELEANALRALFRVYLDLVDYDAVTPKIFLRSDIWKRITAGGFREASHIVRDAQITWNKESLLNLVVRRILRNAAVRDRYSVGEQTTLLDTHKQEELFYRLFPDQVDNGPNRPKTFEWMLSRTRDGTEETAPRELIHLLSAALTTQLQRLEVGTSELSEEGDTLFERATLREALPDVSRVRLEQTLYAEYPTLRQWLERLDREKTEQTPETLADIWDVPEAEALRIATELHEIGFFERRGPKAAPNFWVPFLYRPALHLVQGSADPDLALLR